MFTSKIFLGTSRKTFRIRGKNASSNDMPREGVDLRRAEKYISASEERWMLKKDENFRAFCVLQNEGRICLRGRRRRGLSPYWGPSSLAGFAVLSDFSVSKSVYCIHGVPSTAPQLRTSFQTRKSLSHKQP